MIFSGSHINPSELNALFTLLEDSDEKIFSAVQDRLLSLGPDVAADPRVCGY